MAITEVWLKQRGAVPIAGGDWETIYAFPEGHHYFEVDKTFHTVNRILHSDDHSGLRYLQHMVMAPRHMKCQQPLYLPKALDGTKCPWYCECCGIALELETVGGAS